MTSEAEFLLFAASRAQNVADVIEPALATGAVVLCDRFIDSSIAYQGYGRGLSVDFITAANAFATKGRMPDCTVLLDVPVEVGKARREGGGDVNRLDMEASSFHAKVRDGYLAAAESLGAAVVQSIDEPLKGLEVIARGDSRLQCGGHVVQRVGHDRVQDDHRHVDGLPGARRAPRARG
jgi:dTMP kinase